MPGPSLLAWLDDPRADRGVRFARGERDWELWSYRRLAEHARRVAAGLVDLGIRPGDVVVVVQRSGPSFVATLFGAMLAGAVPSPVAPPMVFQDPAAYGEHLAHLLRTAGAAAVVTDAKLAAAVGNVARSAGVPVVADVEALLGADDQPHPSRRAADIALVQFTSGSSGRPRAVAVPFAALEANTSAIRRWLRAGGDDAWASWLPVHHDMGLIGCLVTPVVGGHDAWLLEPEEFVRRPLRYLSCFGEHGATITATPNFALDYIVRRVAPEAVAGLDFSSWHGIVIGAERIEPGTLDRFHALLAPYGLQRGALLPAYGLAEATLAVTGLPIGEDVACVRLRPESLALGRPVEPDPDGVPVVGCGRPLDGLSVAVVSDDDTVLPDGHVGEVVVRGTSVAAAYVGSGESPSLSRLGDGVLRTGDAGFVTGGQLFVLGRLGDAIKVRGRAVFAEDLEVALAAAGVPATVLLGVDAGMPTVVALLEGPATPTPDPLRRLLAARAEGADVVVLRVPKGGVARTSSGKPRRRWLWQAYVENVLPVLDDGAPADAGAGG